MVHTETQLVLQIKQKTVGFALLASIALLEQHTHFHVKQVTSVLARDLSNINVQKDTIVKLCHNLALFVQQVSTVMLAVWIYILNVRMVRIVVKGL